MLLVKPRLRFVAEQTALDHLRDELRHDEHLAVRIVGKIFVQVFDYVSEHVESHQIERAKRRSLWPAHCRSGDFVDLFNRVAVCQHRANRMQRAERADAIRNKIRAILRHDYAFAQPFVEKAEHRTRDFRLRPFSANQFNQVHVARRIEEVHAQKVRAKIFRASLGQLVKGNAAGVRSNDGARLPVLLDFFVKASFDFKVLDHCFNDQIAVFQLR